MIKQQLIQGCISWINLSENKDSVSLSLPTNIAEPSHKHSDSIIKQKSFSERIQVVQEFVSATDAYIYYADSKEDYGNYYVGATDTIYLSYPVEFFKKEDVSQITEYYHIVFHELGHWTGHPQRLNRRRSNIEGNLNWALEELTAELTSAFLLSKFGIGQNLVLDRTAYIPKWLSVIQVLEDNKIDITSAVKQANQACSYLFQNTFGKEDLDNRF